MTAITPEIKGRAERVAKQVTRHGKTISARQGWLVGRKGIYHQGLPCDKKPTMATSLKIDDTLKSRVQHLASQRRRAPHGIMLEAIRQYVERAKAHEGFKQEAKASWAAHQETGRHLTGREVRAWLNAWASMPKGRFLSATSNRHPWRGGRPGTMPAVLGCQGTASRQAGHAVTALRRRIGAAWFALLMCACASASVPASQAERTPDDSAIEAFAGKAAARFPGADAAEAVADRILDGFQAGPSRLAVGDGTVIYWGFKFQEANLQSVAIYDAGGHPRLLAAVDDVVRLVAGGRQAPLGSMDQYLKALQDSGSTPMISVFVRNAQDLNVYLPYLKRWLQADLLGFNVHCDKADRAPACTLAARIELPIQAYALSPDSEKTRALPVPQVAAAPVPLESFVQ